MNDIKSPCPQCGAPGTAGRFCEYCGTKIPLPTVEKEQQEDGNTSFSWFNVSPAGYQPEIEFNVIGDPNSSLYMVVKKSETRQYVESETVYDDHIDTLAALREEMAGYYVRKHQEIKTRYKNINTYAIINREGQFVVDPQSSDIILFTDNYDYLTNIYELHNLITHELIELEYKADVLTNDYICIGETQIYNRKMREKVVLDKALPSVADLYFDINKEQSTCDTLVFNSYEIIGPITKRERVDYPWSISIQNNFGTVNLPVNNQFKEPEKTKKEKVTEEKPIAPISRNNKSLDVESQNIKAKYKKKIKTHVIICAIGFALAIPICPIFPPYAFLWAIYFWYCLFYVPYCLIKIYRLRK